MDACADSVTLATLVDYLSAELPAAASDALEAHLFRCDDCTERLSAIARVESGVRRLFPRGHVLTVLTSELRARMTAEKVRTREYRVEPGQTVPCGAAPGDDVVILHLVADLAGVTRASVDMSDGGGIFAVRHEDVPIDAASGMVSVAYPGAMIRGLPDLIAEISLRTEGADGPRLTTYRLQHAHAAARGDSVPT